MECKIIVAVDSDFGISKNGVIPWSHTIEGKTDLKWFRKETMGGIVIMGRKTWESIPEHHRPLKNRINIVLSTTINCDGEGVMVMKSLHEAIEYVRTINTDKRVYIIGGSQIYREAISIPNLVHSILITHINGIYECDLFFPRDVLKQFNQVSYINNIVTEYRKELTPRLG